MALDVQTPPEDLTDAELVSEHSEAMDGVDWYGSYEKQRTEWDRAVELWNEIRSRADVDVPECPGCGATRWSQSPGDPLYCSDCGREVADGELSESVHDAWDEMKADVDPDVE